MKYTDWIPHYLLTCTVSAVVCIGTAGCRSGEVELIPRFPVKSARLSFFTGRVPWRWQQEIWVHLEHDVKIRDIIDPRLFGSLQPGLTAEQAAVQLGPPVAIRTDSYGQTWYQYPTPLGVAEIGCENPSSDSHPIGCSWSLYGIPKGSSSEGLLDPRIISYAEEALKARPRTEYLAIHLFAYDDVVTFPIRTYEQRRIRWTRGQQNRATASNKPVNLTVRPVTGLANSARPAPVRPAGYRRR